MWGLPNIPRAVRLIVPPVSGTWPIDVLPLDEPDGGTFYRPASATWHSGTGAPSTSLGDEGDYYMDLDPDTPEWYGPKGEEDEEGDGDWPGPTALKDPGPGDWLHVAGEPDDDGIDGDYYLDTTDMAWWGPKADGSWVGTGPVFVYEENWVTLVNGPSALGYFSAPACILRVGDSNAQTADAWLELVDDNYKRIVLAHACSISAEGGAAVLTEAVPFLISLAKTGKIAKARWKIVGGKGLQWSGSGSLTRLF
jgi:hypothetical protein